MTESQREEVARILEQVAAEGLPHPSNLDAALDALDAIFKMPTEVLVASSDHGFRRAVLRKGLVVKNRFEYFEYAGEDYVEPGEIVLEHWVVE